jgi:hypothetical protein
MARKRMFDNEVISSDNFLEMPDSSQNLYFHLSMKADDDGFIDNFKSIMRMLGKKEDDLMILIAKSFIIPMDKGILVIRHWRLNNYIQKDRYKETLHKKEKALLTFDNNNVYNLDTDWRHSIDKIRLDKISIEENREGVSGKPDRSFKKPTVEEVEEYCKERNNNINPQVFIDFYESKGWLIGKNKMKDWKAAIRTWERRCKKKKMFLNGLTKKSN